MFAYEITNTQRGKNKNKFVFLLKLKCETQLKCEVSEVLVCFWSLWSVVWRVKPTWSVSGCLEAKHSWSASWRVGAFYVPEHLRRERMSCKTRKTQCWHQLVLVWILLQAPPHTHTHTHTHTYTHTHLLLIILETKNVIQLLRKSFNSQNLLTNNCW